MKTLFIACFIGMICFQSCTKEKAVTPSHERNSAPASYIQVPEVTTGKVHGIIRCGTPVPSVIKNNPGTGTPPIFISTQAKK